MAKAVTVESTTFSTSSENEAQQQKQNVQNGCSPSITKRPKQQTSIRARYQKPQPNLLASVKRMPSSVAHNESSALRCHENKSTSNDNVAAVELSDNAAEENLGSNRTIERGKKSLFPTLTTILNSKKKIENDIIDKRRRYAKREMPPERSKMTIVDLIYCNPKFVKTPTMQSTKNETAPRDTCHVNSSHEAVSPVEGLGEGEREANFQTVPKLMISEDGEIGIDQSSLFIQRNVPDISVTHVVEDETTYCSYRKAGAKWCHKETFKFYQALSLFGTDFALMQKAVFPNRTRRELKLKFKREERMNCKLLNKAMYELMSFDISSADESNKEFNISENDEILEAYQERHSGAKKTKTHRRKHNRNTVKRTTFDESRNAQELSNMLTENAPTNKNGIVTTRRKRKAKVLSDDFIDVDDISLDGDDEICDVIHESEVSDKNSLLHEASTEHSPEDTSDDQCCRTSSELSDFSVQNSNQDVINSIGDELNCNEIILTILDSGQSSLTSVDVNEQERESNQHSEVEIETEIPASSSSEQCSMFVTSAHTELNKAVYTDLISEKNAPNVPKELSNYLYTHNYEQGKCTEMAISSIQNSTCQVPNNDQAQSATFVLLEEFELEKSGEANLSLQNNSNEVINHENQPVFVLSNDTEPKSVQIDFIVNNSSEISNSSVPLTVPSLSNYSQPKSPQTLLLSRNSGVSNNLSTVLYSSDEEQIKPVETDFISQEPKSNDDVVLTNVVADEIVSSNKTIGKKSKRKKISENGNLHKTGLSSVKQNNIKFHPSSTVYTPAEESPSHTEEHIQFTPKSNVKTYSHKNEITPKSLELGLSSLQTPVLTPDRVFNTQNCETKFFCSSLNVTKNQPLAIPMTPSPSNKSISSSNVMIFATAPNEENILHLFMYNSTDEQNKSRIISDGGKRKFVQISE